METRWCSRAYTTPHPAACPRPGARGLEPGLNLRGRQPRRNLGQRRMNAERLCRLQQTMRRQYMFLPPQCAGTRPARLARHAKSNTLSETLLGRNIYSSRLDLPQCTLISHDLCNSGVGAAYLYVRSTKNSKVGTSRNASAPARFG